MTMRTPNPGNISTPGCTLQRAHVMVRWSRYPRAVASAIVGMPVQIAKTGIAATSMIARAMAVVMRTSFSASPRIAVMCTMTSEFVIIVVWIEHHLGAENLMHKGVTEVIVC